MPKAKIIGATCKSLGSVTLKGETAVEVTTDAVLISSVVITAPTKKGTSLKTDVIAVSDGVDNIIFSFVTGASGEGGISFPAPLLANGIKIKATEATDGGGVQFFVIA